MSTVNSDADSVTGRGFTGHEHLNRTGFLRMNGRVYDPRIGRFLRADPFVQSPNSSNSYNRYAYVSNSPLSFVDPTGYKTTCVYEFQQDDGRVVTVTQECLEPGDSGGGGGAIWLIGGIYQAGSLYPFGIASSGPVGNKQGDKNPDDMKQSDDEEQCQLLLMHPIAPPGVDIDANMAKAARHNDPRWFYRQVKNGGPWDFKQQDERYQPFGNFHFGATGAAFGFPELILLNEAGIAQVAAGTSRPSYGIPGSRLLFYRDGVAPFGDDPRDQFWITQGIDFQKNRDDWEPCRTP